MKSQTMLLLLALAPLAPAADLERPARKPDGGAYFEVSVAVPLSSLDLLSGPKANYRGKLWLERLVGKKFRGGCDLTMQDRSGNPVTLPDIGFQVDANLNVTGAEEDLSGPTLPNALCRRAVASSGISLLPVRALLPHLMEYESRQRKALAEWQAVGATSEMRETNLGPKRLRGTMADQYFTHAIRRLQPSGYELHDFVLTCEDTSEEEVMYARGLRLLVHPTLKLPDGGAPPSGVLQMLTFSAHQLEWLSDQEYLSPQEQSSLDSKYEDSLVNALFNAIDGEGVGNPFESPAAFALASSGLLDERTMRRMVALKNSKLLTLTAPLVVDNPFAFDPELHLTFWNTADDPAERLLLAAAATVGGAKEAAFAKEGRMALGSNDPIVLKAALVLGKALKDQDLISRAEWALGSF
ncbi:MAG: hypothetical protein V2A76_05345 [Planctomycetota bacterium]